MTSKDGDAEQSDQTLELPALLQIATRRGWLAADAASAVAGRAAAGEGDVVDLLLDEELLSHQQFDVLLHLLDPTGLVPGYEIVDVLGQGAMGVVYRARQLALNREVALKTIRIARLDDRQAVARARAEAVTVAQLSHQNVATAYDQGVHDGRLYLAMEFVDGENWDDRIGRDGPMDERIVWGIALQVAAGLAHAAERGVVHRDVKPANVLLSDPASVASLPEGVPLAKITDFGIALGPREEGDTRLTQTGAGLGTPDYVAPEQLLSSDVDLRADVYSLGASVCHALRGERLFGDSIVMQVVRSKMTGDESWRKFPESVSPSSVALVERMTNHDPSDRIGDYRQLMLAIDGVLDHLEGRDDRRYQPVPAGRSARPVAGWMLIGLMAASLALVAVVCWPLLTSPTVPPRATDLERNGQMTYLFDGESAPIGRQRGSWGPSFDALGGTRLSGTDGWIVFTTPTEGFSLFQLRFGLDLGTASAVEVHFPVSELAPAKGERNVLRITSSGTQLGVRPGFDDEIHVTNTREPHGAAKGDYLAVVVLRQEDAWYVDIEDAEVGGVAARDAGQATAVLVRAVGGTAHFEGVEVVGLERTPP